MELWDYARLSEDELILRINKARAERNAVILAHNYQRLQIQDIADFLGDSLQLAKKATRVDADVIVFCGVMFMAEVAAILNPDKTVLIPEIQAGCPLAAGATAEDIIQLKRKYPDFVVVTYVNSTAETKAVSDITCTSSNSVEVINSFPPHRGIIFVPDKNLCRYAKLQSGRDNIICWDSNCYVHDRLTIQDLKQAKSKYPDATIIVHPECPPDVQDAADFIFSTGGMYKYAKEHQDETIVLGTEIGLIERIRNEFPKVKVYPMSEKAICSNMKLITLPKVARSLEQNMYKVEVPENVAQRAKMAIEQMLEVK
ncbi:quinolinate synthase [bacterium]|nr:MAG: quinolinate synthase [bacterium]